MKKSSKLFVLTIIVFGLLLISPTISFGKKTLKSLNSLTTTVKNLEVKGYFSIHKKTHTISSRQDFWIKVGTEPARKLNVTADGFTIPEYTPGRYLSGMDGYEVTSGKKIVVEIKLPASPKIQPLDQPKKKQKVTAIATIGNMAAFTQPLHEGSYTISRHIEDIEIIWTRGKAPYALSIYEDKSGGKCIYYKEGIMSTTHSVPSRIFTKKGKYAVYLTYTMTRFTFSGDYQPSSKIRLKYLTLISFKVK